MKPQILTPLLAATLLIGIGGSKAAQAKNAPGSAKQSYISVMSKAGTPTPRPNVPVRYQGAPNNPRTGYDYYYGLGQGGGYGYIYASPGYGTYQQRAAKKGEELPGYRTEPGESRIHPKSFVNY